VKKLFNYGGLLLALCIVLLSASCKKKTPAPAASDDKRTYFSIQQFALDEWNTYAGEPFLIRKTVTVDNKSDSSFTNSDTLDWSGIFKTFFAAEISDPKYLGHYNVKSFADDDDFTINIYYEANEDDLFTRKLLITIDRETRLVRGIYIETIKESLLKATVQKLYYRPMKTVQIQTIEKPVWGAEKHTVLQYDFIR
jgi:hypothetical protein